MENSEQEQERLTNFWTGVENKALAPIDIINIDADDFWAKKFTVACDDAEIIITMQEYGDYRAKIARNEGIIEALELAIMSAKVLSNFDKDGHAKPTFTVDANSILNLKKQLIK